MAQNSLSPSFLRLRYSNTVTLVNHFMTLPVAPSDEWTPGVEPMLLPKSAPPISLSAFLDDFLPFIRPFFAAATNISLCDAYWQSTPDTDPIWVYAQEIGLAGTNVGSTVAYSQGTLTSRTFAGGIQKLVLVEGASAVNFKDDFPFGSTNLTNLADYLKSSACPIWGRDNAYIIGSIRWITKTNDALRKRGMLGS